MLQSYVNAPACRCASCASLRRLDGGGAAANADTTGAQADSSQPYYIQALLPSYEPRWSDGSVFDNLGGTPGTASSVSYSFLSSSPIYADATDSNGFAPVNDTQKAAFRQAFAIWASVCNLTFTEVTDGLASEIRIGTNDQNGASSGWAYYPDVGSGGDIYLANDMSGMESPTAGSFAFSTVLHEIGHSIGLKHPGNYSGDEESPFLPSGEDNNQYSVMSYPDHPTMGGSVQNTMLSLYDIAAAQYLYGANTGYNSGDTSYSYSNSGVFMASIWDGGGNDVIDAGNQTLGVKISLNAGEFSSIGVGTSAASAVDNVVIAYNVTIENAVGGSGNDTITGNSGANRIDALAGDDRISSRGGADTIIGGAGNDWLDLGGGTVSVSGIETLIGGSGADYVALDAAGTVILAAVETLIGSGGGDYVNLGNRGNTMIMAGIETLIGGSGGDFINLGNRGATMIMAGIETLVGGSGADRVTLGNRGSTMVVAAVETLIGGSGADRVTLGNRGGAATVSGVETLTGGSGADTVTISAGTVRFQGAAGADNLTLAGGGGADAVVFASANDGGAAGADGGYDQISGFLSGTDRVVVSGDLRGLVDRNSDASVAAATRSGGTADLIADELIILSTTTTLADADLASFRTALGAVATDGTPRSALVLASDGTDSGLYLLSENGDGVGAAGETRLLARFTAATLSAGDFSFG